MRSTRTRGILMKLKAVLHKGAPEDMVHAIQRSAFRAEILNLLRQNLRVGEFGPAEFYIQECDFAVGSDPMCEVRLTGVSVNERRATADFIQMRRALEELYYHALEPHVLEGGRRLQLMVSLMVDQVPFGLKSPLIEGEPIWIGEDTKPDEEDDDFPF